MKVTDLTRPQLEHCFGRATGYAVPERLSGVHKDGTGKIEFWTYNEDRSYRTDLSMWDDGTMCVTGYDKRLKSFQSIPFNPRPLLAYLDSLGVVAERPDWMAEDVAKLIDQGVDVQALLGDDQSGLLPEGTLNCPGCNKPLEFEQMCGMRVVREGVYNTRCGACKKEYEVKTHSDE